MWPLLAIGAGLGVLKNIEGQNQASQQRKAQAEIQKWSPWTGLQGQTVKDPSLIGDIATGGAIGASANAMFPGGAPGAAAAAGDMGAAVKGAGGSYAPQFSFDGGQQPSWLSMMKGQQQLPSLYSLK